MVKTEENLNRALTFAKNLITEAKGAATADSVLEVLERSLPTTADKNNQED